jgi:hypothetical protein
MALAYRSNFTKNSILRGDNAMKKTIHLLVIWGLFILMATGMTGCFTMTALDNISDEKGGKPLEFPEISDTIIALGQPDKAFLNNLGHPNTIVLLGIKRSYFLLNGGETIMQISKELNGNNIDIDQHEMRMNEDHSIVGYQKTHTMFFKDNKIWGSFTVSYHHDEGVQFSKEELSTLNKLEFIKSTTDKDTYTKKVNFEGVVGSKITIPDTQAQTMKKNRSISFYAPSSSTIVPTIGKYIVIPLAVVADAVTTPIAIVGLPIIMLTSGPWN